MSVSNGRTKPNGPIAGGMIPPLKMPQKLSDCMSAVVVHQRQQNVCGFLYATAIVQCAIAYTDLG